MSKIAKPAFFNVEERADVTLVRFPYHELAATDLSRIRELWSFLDAQKLRPSKVLALLVPAGLLTPENLDRYWRILVEMPPGARASRAVSEEARLSLIREENAAIQFIEGVRSIDAFVILALQGRIDLLFLGPALACDYRIVADDCVFVGRSLELGLPTCEGLPWFLVRHLGQGKAAELLLSGRDTTARGALELSLVSEVVALAELEERVLQTAARFARRPRPGLVALKRALVAAEMPLDEYLLAERSVFERCTYEGEGLRKATVERRSG